MEDERDPVLGSAQKKTEMKMFKLPMEHEATSGWRWNQCGTMDRFDPGSSPWPDKFEQSV